MVEFHGQTKIFYCISNYEYSASLYPVDSNFLYYFRSYGIGCPESYFFKVMINRLKFQFVLVENCFSFHMYALK